MKNLTIEKLDTWQKTVLETKGDIVLRSGRQVGKSTVISIKAAEYAIENANKKVLIIASVERQAYMLFEKTLAYLMDNYKHMILKGKYKPTKHKIYLKNGSEINSLPCGLTGYGIRGMTVDLLIADEAAFIPEEVWTAVTPMLAVTKTMGGMIILLSTPHGKEGFYYDCFNNPDFTKFHISSEECPRIDKKFLKREQERMTKSQYAQEYLGEFIDELRQFFNSDLIRACMNIDEQFVPPENTKRFLGVDIARMGKDETVLASLYEYDKQNILMFNLEVLRKSYITETTKLILIKDRQYNYKKIFIDDGGMGVGVFDPLLKEPQTRRKVVAINNAGRDLDWGKDKTRQKKLNKEVLYFNLLNFMEKGYIRLLTNDEIFLSLKSIQYEYTDKNELKIFGNYSHITEALVRAAWGFNEKHLNIWGC